MAEKNSNKKQKKGEEVCEIFEVEKDGKKVLKKECGSLPTKHADKKEIERQEKILRNVLIILGVVFVVLLVFLVVWKGSSKLEYEGAKFYLVQEGSLQLYNFKFQMINSAGVHTADYNIYLRNDPRKIGKEILFDGDFALTKNTVINATENINCNGDGIIGVANVVNLLELFESKVIKDPNADCDADGRYTFISIRGGDENKIVQTGPSCYELFVKNCEVLKVTERFMLEGIIEYFRE